jgi:hypothetical protein
MKHHILRLVENLPVPFDRRVWQEALACTEHGSDAFRAGNLPARVFLKAMPC